MVFFMVASSAWSGGDAVCRIFLRRFSIDDYCFVLHFEFCTLIGKCVNRSAMNGGYIIMNGEFCAMNEICDRVQAAKNIFLKNPVIF
jgi:hypothetical protein